MKDTEDQSWSNLIRMGFWLGVGYSLAFILMMTIFSILFAGIMNTYVETYNRQTLDQLKTFTETFKHSIPKVVSPAIPTPPKSIQPRPTSVGQKSYLRVGDPKQRSETEQKELDCSLAILRFNQSSSEKDKQDVDRLCPQSN